MNNDKIIPNENKVIPNENIIGYNNNNIIFNPMQIGNHTRKEKTPREVLSDLSADTLSYLFERIDTEMSCLVSKILTFETISIENKEYLEQLSSYYKACKLVLQELSKKERIPMKHFFYHTNISDVERILTEYKLLSIQEEAKKKSHRK